MRAVADELGWRHHSLGPGRVVRTVQHHQLEPRHVGLEVKHQRAQALRPIEGWDQEREVAQD